MTKLFQPRFNSGKPLWRNPDDGQLRRPDGHYQAADDRSIRVDDTHVSANTCFHVDNLLTRAVH